MEGRGGERRRRRRERGRAVGVGRAGHSVKGRVEGEDVKRRGGQRGWGVKEERRALGSI